MAFDRHTLIFMATLAEKAELFDDMASFMSSAVKLSPPLLDLSIDHRNLLFTAFKHRIGPLRSAWRVVSSIADKEKLGDNDQEKLGIIRSYIGKIESELSQACEDVLKLLDEHLIPSSASAESKVFYLKMKGDYNRYLAEFKTGQEKKDTADNTLAAYKSAQDIAVAEMASTHPMRLGLALNFSVFYYEILDSSDRACNLAQQAFDEAISELDTLGEESYKDSTLIMQLLRDNLTLWKSADALDDDINSDDSLNLNTAPKIERTGFAP